MPRTVVYTLETESGEEWVFDLSFDEATHYHIRKDTTELPKWTELAFNKCLNCPLSEADVSHCPAAVSMHEVVSQTSGHLSFQRVKARVVTESRTFEKETDLQSALFSLLGLVISSSQCPRFEFLRPMAAFHLPFSSASETAVRVAGFHLVAQYIRKLNGQPAELDLSELEESYLNVETVNNGLARRLTEATKGDASPNALAILNTFSQMFALDASSNYTMLREVMEPLLKAAAPTEDQGL